MSVAIRFSRQGKKRSPFYRIVAADKRSARDGPFIELLGTYHPSTKVLKLDEPAIAGGTLVRRDDPIKWRSLLTLT